jgi:hypothetical protein
LDEAYGPITAVEDLRAALVERTAGRAGAVVDARIELLVAEPARRVLVRP